MSAKHPGNDELYFVTHNITKSEESEVRLRHGSLGGQYMDRLDTTRDGPRSE